jgi:hypothetical protein
MFNKVLQRLQTRFSPNRNIVKPIPERDFQDNNNKALDFYYQQNRAKEDYYKKQAGQQKPLNAPQGFSYNKAVANAPSKKQMKPIIPTMNLKASIKSGGLSMPQQKQAVRPAVAVKGVAASNITPTPTPRPDMTDYERLTAETFDKYEIPRAVAFGMAGAENGTRNRFNIGAWDSNPNNAMIQDDLSNATSAAKMLSGQADTSFYGNGEAGKQAYAKAYAQRKNAAKMLQMIRDAAFAGDPKTWKQRSIEQGGAGQFYDSWDEFIKNTPAWRKWSK